MSLYCDLMSGAVLDGIRAEIAASGGDVGELDEPPSEDVPAGRDRRRGRRGIAGRVRPALREPISGPVRKTGPICTEWS